MPIYNAIKILRVSLLFLMIQLGGVSLAFGAEITLDGRVMYSTGEPAGGVTVTMTKTIYDVTPNIVTTESSATDSSGHYSFQGEPRCAVVYAFKGVSPLIVDDEPLPPSSETSISGCVLNSTTMPNITISKPYLITLSGVVRDSSSTPVQGLTITMTRTKYNLNPPVVTTATTTTDGTGRYQFTVYSRCSVVEEFKASHNGVVFQGGISISGCVLSSNNSLDFSVGLGNILENAGGTSCNGSVPRPVNVTNGNMYLQQTDYQLPGVGEAIAISRTYNSISTSIGLFGRGWTIAYDETVTTDANNRLQLTMSDGRLITFTTPDFFGQIVKNGDGSYTVTFKDGRVHQFNAAGKLLSQTDLNGNQTTLTYDGGGKLISVTDPSGRVLTITTNAGGRVLSISDTMGTIAAYAYGSSNELLSVTYADNSQFQFEFLSNVVYESIRRRFFECPLVVRL